MNHAWVLLGFAIAAELFGTSCLKASAGFARLWPSLGVVAGYAAAFGLMAQALKFLPVGLVYAIWSGLGTIGIALIGWMLFREVLSALAWAGIALVVAGVVVLNLAAPRMH